MTTVWFVAIAVLWTGYFVLEGFDFGVGMLLARLSPADRRVALGAIGPVWDGNEVWLITALGAMFAAFPSWYAGMLSGFYLPMLLIVVALILRGVGLEYGHRSTDHRWWDRAIVAGSGVAAFGWGAVFAMLVRGVDVGPGGVVAVPDPVGPAALLGGTVAVALSLLHGSTFLALKTDGPVRARAGRAARRLLPAALLLVAAGVAAAVLTAAARGAPTQVAVAGVASVLALIVAGVALERRREGWAFAATAVAIATLAATVFLALYPAVLPDLDDPARSLTVDTAAAGPYTLRLLSIIGAVLLPLVIAYQGWSYWVFRQRVTR